MTDRSHGSVVWDRPVTYRIRVRGVLDARQLERLGGMAVECDVNGDLDGEISLVGRMRDQAALSGVLNTIYEMHLPIVSVEALKVGKGAQGDEPCRSKKFVP